MRGSKKMVQFIKKSCGQFSPMPIYIAIILGVLLASMSLKAFAMQQTDHTVSDNFVPNSQTKDAVLANTPWEVTFTFNTDGMIEDGNSNQIVDGGKIMADEGENTEFSAEANLGYHISSVVIDSTESVDGTFDNNQTSYSHTFANISKNHSVTVTFSINTYNIEIKLIGEGSIFVGESKADAIQSIKHGETLTLTPAEGFDVKEILLDNIQSDTYVLSSDDISYIYDLASVTDNHILSVEFTQIEEISGNETDFYEIKGNDLLNGYPIVSDGIQVYNFKNNGALANLVPKDPYSRIRMNGSESADSISLTHSVLINSIEVYKADQPDKGWKIVSMHTPIQVIIDQIAPVMADIASMEWTSNDYSVCGEISDEDLQTAPTSGLARVVWSKTPLTKEQALAETANTTIVLEGKYSFTISTEHNNETFYVYGIDKADNVSDAKTTALKIDKTKPEITEFTFQQIDQSILSKVISFLTFGTFFNDEIEVIISGQDVGSSSGLKEITLYSDNIEVETKPVQGDFASFKLTPTCFSDNEITASVKDIVGNESLERTRPTKVKSNVFSDKISLKSEKPVISIKAVDKAIYTSEEENWYDGDVEFNVSVNTSSGGIYSVAIKVNDQFITTDKKGKDINAKFFESYTLQETFTVSTDMNSLEGENTIEVIALNNYGNEEKSIIKSFIDTTNPEIVGFNMNKKNDNVLSKILHFLTFGNFFNEKIIITVQADDDKKLGSGISTITLFADGETIDGSPKVATVTEDGTYQAEFTLPDDVIPDIKLLDTALAAIATDNIGHITGQDDDNPEGDKVTPSSVNSELKSDRLVIETIVPTLEMSSPEAFYTDNNHKKWYFENIPFTITAKDEDAGIQSVQIKINGVEILNDLNEKAINAAFYEKQTQEEIFSIDTSQGERASDGSYLVEVIVMDNAGNKTSATDIVYKDIDNPVIAKYQFVPTASDGSSETSEFVEHLEYGFYFKEEVKVMIQVTDPGASSGLDTLKYRLVTYKNGEKEKETKGKMSLEEGKAEIILPEGFKGQIYAEASDNTAHISGEQTSKGFVIDGSAPEIKIEYNNSTDFKDAEGNKLFVDEISFMVEITDYVTGIKQIEYRQNSEKESLEKTILVNNEGYKIGDHLEDEWKISEMDVNLVTKVTKTFTIDDDDNGILFTFKASDRSANLQQDVATEKMTFDKTAPTIDVVFRNDESKNSYYYSANRVADIRVTERNFDQDRIKATIENKFGEIPNIDFTSESNTEHVAVVDFGEGDYTFELTGSDRGNQEAMVNFNGGNENLFYVDKTKPIIEDNFSAFHKPETKDSFNIDKTVELQITEHNFSPDLVNLKIQRKEPGAEHTAEGLYDITWEIVSGSEWESSGDNHSIAFTLSEDGVYQIEINTIDLAENSSDIKSTIIFELDKTAPIVTARNGLSVKDSDLRFADIYPYEKKEEAAPTIEFEDANIEHLRYELLVYIPKKSTTEEGTIIRPVRTYLTEDSEKSGAIKGNKFTLPGFTKDGVYALEIIAVDVAGNESLTNVNTYARMIEQDVLAYIMESNVADKTGIYSLQYENGEPISKRPDNFSDIKIQVLAKKASDIEIVLRDNNADEINTNTKAEADESIYGMGIYNCTLKGDFFKEKFQGDTDVELRLAVNSEGKRIDLGKVHIDNIAPSCTLPEEFKSWSWYYGDEVRSITISDISELIDENQCKVYDNGKESAFTYSSKDNTLAFTLDKGWHNVGVILDDVAGNANNIQEKANIHIGFFWLWVIVAFSVTILMASVCVILCHIKKKSRLEEELWQP